MVKGMKEQNKKQDKRSPLKAPPLRNPGQSLDEEISRIINDEAFVHIMLAMFALVFTLMEWWRWYFKVPQYPIIITIITAFIWAYVFRKLLLTKRKLHTLKQGRDGEKAVGQYLEVIQPNPIVLPVASFQDPGYQQEDGRQWKNAQRAGQDAVQ